MRLCISILIFFFPILVCAQHKIIKNLEVVDADEGNFWNAFKRDSFKTFSY